MVTISMIQRNRTTTVQLLFACLIIASSLLSQRLLNADENQSTLLQRIAESWAERQTRFENVHLVASGKTMIPKGTITLPDSDEPSAPLEDHVYQRKLDILLDVSNKRCRRNEVCDIFNTSDREFNRWVRHSLFDGTSYQILYPRDEYKREGIERGPYDTDLQLQGVSRPFMFIQSFEIPLLFFLGMIPTGDFGPESPSIKFPFDLATVLDLAPNDGREFARIEIADEVGSDCRNVYRVDLERFEVMERSRHIQDREISNISIEYADFGGVRFPSQWRLQRYEIILGGKTRTEDTRMTTKNVQFDVHFPDSYFSIKPTPGMNVSDSATGKRFRVAQPGEPVRTIEEIYQSETANR